MSASPWKRFMPYLERGQNPREDLTAALAAASRRVLSTPRDLSSHDRPIFEIGASVAGPILTAYVLWVFRRAREEGIHRIYWISRDGQVLLEIARRLQELLGSSFEHRYLYGSRTAWHLPALSGRVPLNAVPWIVEDAEYLSVDQVLRRLRLDAEKFEPEIRRAGLSAYARLGTEAHKLADLLSEPRIRDAALAVVAKRRPLFEAYLEQEGLTDGTPSAIVDVGWRGQLAGTLERGLERMGAEGPMAFYVGLIPGQSRRAGRHEAWLFDGQPEDGPLSVGGVFEAFETFCAGTHALVTGYRSTATGEVGPIMDERGNLGPISWGLRTYRAAIGAFLAELRLPRTVDPFVDTRDACAHLLEAFWRNPTPEEARAWGRFPTDVDQGGVVQRPLAGRYGVRHAFTKGLLGPRRVSTETYWIGGTKAAASSAAHVAFKAGRRLRNALKKSVPGLGPSASRQAGLPGQAKRPRV